MASAFILVPRAEGAFAALDPLARLCFGHIWNRYQLSRLTRHSGRGAFVMEVPADMRDRYKRPSVDYCVYSAAEMAVEIGCTDRTVRRCIADLRAAGVIDTHRNGYMGKLCFTIPTAICDELPDELRRRVLGKA